MPSASEAVEVFPDQPKREIRCRVPHRGSWRHPKGRPCNHLLVRDASIACTCGQQHNLIGLVAEATAGSWKAYMQAQAILAREFWQLRVRQVVTSYYRYHGTPRYYEPELPDWIVDRLDLCDAHGFRPGFFFNEEQGGGWMLFELDPMKNWIQWDFSGQRCLSFDNMTLAREVLAQKLELPQSQLVVPASASVWKHIRLWRERWSLAESVYDSGLIWEAGLHQIGNQSGVGYLYSLLTGALSSQQLNPFDELRFEFMIAGQQ